MGELYFVCEVHAVIAYDKGVGLAVGGTFTQVIVEGKTHNIANLAIVAV